MAIAVSADVDIMTIAIHCAQVMSAPAASFDQRWSVRAAAFGARSTGGNDIVGSHTLAGLIYGSAIGADYRLLPDILLGFAMAGGGTGFGTLALLA